MKSLVYHGISPAPPATAFTVELLARAPYSARDNPVQSSLGIALERQTGVHAIGSDRREDFDTWPGTMAFTPAGLDVFSESATGGEYLVVRWHEAGTCAVQPPLARPQRTAPPALLQQGLALRALLLGQAPASPVDAAVQRLLGALDALQAPRAEAPDLPALRERYARLLERIDDELGGPDEDLSLAALSAAVTLPPIAFLRQFRQLTGMTPHAYVSERRLQRARQAMLRQGGSLADVAAAAGYASQSHMGTAFKRVLGLTPAAYRRRTGEGGGPSG